MSKSVRRTAEKVRPNFLRPPRDCHRIVVPTRTQMSSDTPCLAPKNVSASTETSRQGDFPVRGSGTSIPHTTGVLRSGKNADLSGLLKFAPRTAFVTGVRVVSVLIGDDI